MVSTVFSCAPRDNSKPQGAVEGQVSQNEVSASGEAAPAEPRELALEEKLRIILQNAELPQDLARELLIAAQGDPGFLLDLLACLDGDPYLRVLTDKTHALPPDYSPQDLSALISGGAYRISRNGLMVRRAAAAALDEMAAAAMEENVTLLASSAYRSYDYQAEVYARNVREMGEREADRVSARPGHSQHQLGLVLDFGSIDDSFAETRAGIWLAGNASRFGWSMSYPQGYEDVTGYRWESWHFRYVGRDLAAFIDTYFRGIQQYALRFIYEWEKAGGV